MTKEQFEYWVGEFLKTRFHDSSKDSDVWRNEVLRRYYNFGATFMIPDEDLYSMLAFGLWFLGGQK